MVWYFRFIVLVLLFATGVLTGPQAKDNDLLKQEFVSGECTPAEKQELLKIFHVNYLLIDPPISYTVDEVQIDRRRMSSPPTGKKIEPLKTVFCLAKSGNKILITTADTRDKSCGWVEERYLAEVKDVRFGSISMGPCGTIRPISMQNFCSKINQWGVAVRACDNGLGPTSLQVAKFITLGTNYNGNGNALRKEKINVYPTPTSTEPIGSIEIFNTLPVYDLNKNVETGNVRLLLGVNRNLKCWIDYGSGLIFESRLSVYFSHSGDKNILKLPIGQKSNTILATPPSITTRKLQQTGKIEFYAFPVIFDHRVNSISQAENKPHLEITFSAPSPDGSQDLVGIGFIETAEIGKEESNWNYYISLSKSELDAVKKNMGTVCNRLGGGDSVKTVQNMALDLVGTLTGDMQSFSRVKIQESSTPLIYGLYNMDWVADLMKLVRTDGGLTKYKKEVCRSYTLIQMMQLNLKVEDPEEGRDLLWLESSYGSKNNVKYKWLSTELGSEKYYLPLNYLPRF